MILLRKSTVMVNHVIEVRVALLCGKKYAIWLIGTWTYQGSLPSLLL